MQARADNGINDTSTFNDEELYDGYGGFVLDETPGGRVRAYAPDPVGFGGQYGYYTDVETKLQSLTHRYYDAGAGRFLNRDPAGYGGGINLYGFAGNDPINEQDPSGLNPFMDFLRRLTGTKLKQGTPTIGGAAAEKRREIQELTAGPEDDAGVNQTMQADPRNHLSRVGPAVSGGLATMGGIIATGALGAGAEGIGGEETAAGLTASKVRFPFLKDHALRHGDGLDPAQYLQDAINNINTGRRFLVRHNRSQKLVFLRRIGVDEFQFTSTSMNRRTIFTHFKVDTEYLRNKGITLPKDF